MEFSIFDFGSHSKKLRKCVHTYYFAIKKIRQMSYRIDRYHHLVWVCSDIYVKLNCPLIPFFCFVMQMYLHNVAIRILDIRWWVEHLYYVVISKHSIIRFLIVKYNSKKLKNDFKE